MSTNEQAISNDEVWESPLPPFSKGRNSGGCKPAEGFCMAAVLLRRDGRKMNGIHVVISLMAGLLICFLAAHAGDSEAVDNRIYAELLKKYVARGKVDYRGFQSEEDRLDQYLEVLEGTDPDALSREEQFAFYVNVYNAWTIKLILTRYPDIQSIKDIGGIFNSPWKQKIVRLNGGLFALDDIEHNILRPLFRDPRIHFVINCASVSCPPLRSEPYSATILQEQLTEATTAFINDPERNRIEGNILFVSKIFKWFPEDFNEDVVGFVSSYARGDFRDSIAANQDRIKIKYLEYDWSLNGK
jgi:hypothetical protein